MHHRLLLWRGEGQASYARADREDAPDENVATLMEITGGQLNTRGACRMLSRHNGNIETASNDFFDLLINDPSKLQALNEEGSNARGVVWTADTGDTADKGEGGTAHAAIPAACCVDGVARWFQEQLSALGCQVSVAFSDQPCPPPPPIPSSIPSPPAGQCTVILRHSLLSALCSAPPFTTDVIGTVGAHGWGNTADTGLCVLPVTIDGSVWMVPAALLEAVRPATACTKCRVTVSMATGSLALLQSAVCAAASKVRECVTDLPVHVAFPDTSIIDGRVAVGLGWVDAQGYASQLVDVAADPEVNILRGLRRFTGCIAAVVHSSQRTTQWEVLPDSTRTWIKLSSKHSAALESAFARGDRVVCLSVGTSWRAQRAFGDHENGQGAAPSQQPSGVLLVVDLVAFLATEVLPAMPETSHRIRRVAETIPLVRAGDTVTLNSSSPTYGTGNVAVGDTGRVLYTEGRSCVVEFEKDAAWCGDTIKDLKPPDATSPCKRQVFIAGPRDAVPRAAKLLGRQDTTRRGAVYFPAECSMMLGTVKARLSLWSGVKKLTIGTGIAVATGDGPSLARLQTAIEQTALKVLQETQGEALGEHSNTVLEGLATHDLAVPALANAPFTAPPHTEPPLYALDGTRIAAEDLQQTAEVLWASFDDYLTAMQRRVTEAGLSLPPEWGACTAQLGLNVGDVVTGAIAEVGDTVVVKSVVRPTLATRRGVVTKVTPQFTTVQLVNDKRHSFHHTEVQVLAPPEVLKTRSHWTAVVEELSLGIAEEESTPALQRSVQDWIDTMSTGGGTSDPGRPTCTKVVLRMCGESGATMTFVCPSTTDLQRVDAHSTEWSIARVTAAVGRLRWLCMVDAYLLIRLQQGHTDQVAMYAPSSRAEEYQVLHRVLTTMRQRIERIVKEADTAGAAIEQGLAALRTKGDVPDTLINDLQQRTTVTVKEWQQTCRLAAFDVALAARSLRNDAVQYAARKRDREDAWSSVLTVAADTGAMVVRDEQRGIVLRGSKDAIVAAAERLEENPLALPAPVTETIDLPQDVSARLSKDGGTLLSIVARLSRVDATLCNGGQSLAVTGTQSAVARLRGFLAIHPPLRQHCPPSQPPAKVAKRSDEQSVSGSLLHRAKAEVLAALEGDSKLRRCSACSAWMVLSGPTLVVCKDCGACSCPLGCGRGGHLNDMCSVAAVVCGRCLAPLPHGVGCCAWCGYEFCTACLLQTKWGSHVDGSVCDPEQRSTRAEELRGMWKGQHWVKLWSGYTACGRCSKPLGVGVGNRCTACWNTALCGECVGQGCPTDRCHPVAPCMVVDPPDETPERLIKRKPPHCKCGGRLTVSCHGDKWKCGCGKSGTGDRWHCKTADHTTCFACLPRVATVKALGSANTFHTTMQELVARDREEWEDGVITSGLGVIPDELKVPESLSVNVGVFEIVALGLLRERPIHHLAV